MILYSKKINHNTYTTDDKRTIRITDDTIVLESDQGVKTRFFRTGDVRKVLAYSNMTEVPRATVYNKNWSRTVPSFYMDLNPITNKEFLDFVKKYPQWKRDIVKSQGGHRSYLKHWLNHDIISKYQQEEPVDYISHSAALAYCKSHQKVLPKLSHYRVAVDAHLGGLSVRHLALYDPPQFNFMRYEWTNSWWDAQDFDFVRILYGHGRPHLKTMSRVEKKSHTEAKLGFRCVLLIEP